MRERGDTEPLMPHPSEPAGELDVQPARHQLAHDTVEVHRRHSTDGDKHPGCASGDDRIDQVGAELDDRDSQPRRYPLAGVADGTDHSVTELRLGLEELYQRDRL